MLDYVVLDTETTGLSPTANEIIEIGAWEIQGGVAVRKYSTLIKPRGYISRDIQRITGITPDMVADERDISEVIPEFCDFVGDKPLLGYNLPFDFEFLVNKCKPCGYDFTLGGTRKGIDALSLARKYFPNMKHSLGEMINYLNINTNSDCLHRAYYDAYMTKLVYDRFLYLFQDSPDVIEPRVIGVSVEPVGKAMNNGTLSFK